MPQEQSNTRQRTRYQLLEPDQYNVIMHNDDFTTMEFVVMVLKTVFGKPLTEAHRLMLTVHKSGQACIGTYTLDMAQTKSQKAMRMAREAGFPFKLTVEPNGLPF